MVAELPAFCGWLPHPEHWLRIAEPVALFHRIGWLCHPGIINSGFAKTKNYTGADKTHTVKDLAVGVSVCLPYNKTNKKEVSVLLASCAFSNCLCLKAIWSSCAFSNCLCYPYMWRLYVDFGIFVSK